MYQALRNTSSTALQCPENVVADAIDRKGGEHGLQESEGGDRRFPDGSVGVVNSIQYVNQQAEGAQHTFRLSGSEKAACCSTVAVLRSLICTTALRA
jgi:hypothetical protein